MERYYQKEIECAAPEKIRELQNERLVKQVKHVWDNVPYYRKKMEEKGVTPDDIKGLDDLHKLPFTDRHDRIHWDLVCEALRDTGYDGDFTFEIISYLERVPADLMPQALAYAAAVGRKLIALCGK